MGNGGVSGMSGPMWMPSEPPSFGRIFAFHPQPLPIVPVLALIGLILYAYGIARLRQRGIRWGAGRTIAFVAGIAMIEFVTLTGIEGYGMMMFSVHMAQHMMLTMVAPILLLIGAPITLALRALPSTGTTPGARTRRGLIRLLHSLFLRVLVSPPVRWFFFLSGLYVIYFSSLFDRLMATVWGHNVMLIHFIVIGLLFFAPLVRADPFPGTSQPGFRVLETFASTPFHAFFGIAVMMATAPLEAYFTDPPASWHLDILRDQYKAGMIAWTTAEFPTLLLIGVIVVQWVRSDAREARRHDRQADRSGDAELEAYNRRLAALAERDSRATH